jgi:hypothetical protein
MMTFKERLDDVENDLLILSKTFFGQLEKTPRNFNSKPIVDALWSIIKKCAFRSLDEPDWLSLDAWEKTATSPPKRCTNSECNAPSCNPGVTLRPCSVCKTAEYCCKECQTEDWKEHKKVCRPSVVPTCAEEAAPADVKVCAKKSTTSEVEACANCAATVNDGVQLFPCAGCKLVRYCGKACQTQHWKGQSGHKKFCVKKEDRVPVAAAKGASVETCKEGCCAVCMCELKCDLKGDLKCDSKGDLKGEDNAKAKDTAELRCGHVLHAECLKTYACMSETKTCPICRASL